MPHSPFRNPKSALAFLLLTPLLRAQSLPPDSAFSPPKLPLPSFSNVTLNVKDFGAKGDGQSNDTAALNAAIEKASSTPGGATVSFPPGKYMVASAHLRSNVRLLLDKDAVIEGLKLGYLPPEPNPQFDKYQDFGHSHFHNAVLYGESVENFAIVGGGKLNGGGVITGDPKSPTSQPDGSQLWGGDKVISIKVGKNLLFENVTHDTGGHFVYLLNDCENVTLHNIVIKKSRDAVDLMGCRNVAVHGCNFTGCGDDTLGIKSDYALGRRILTENIYAWDNYFESGCNGLQFGSETAGDFRNVYLWNTIINKAMKAGIGITSNDSANIENVHYKNIIIKNAANPIFFLMTRRMRTGQPDAKVGSIRNITLENITCSEVVAGKNHGPANASTLSGLPESPIENVTFKDLQISYKGNDDAKDASVVPPYPKDYSPKSMGPRPASAFYIRHAKNITFQNCTFTFESPTNKPPLVLSDVHTITFDTVKVPKPHDTDLLRFDNSTDLTFPNSPTLQPTPAR